MPSQSTSALDQLLSQSTGGMRTTTDRPATCCCGRDQCAYLEHNETALKGLEQELQSAAQVGQALLARHEAYMVDAEQERRTMGAHIDKLESDKKELEESNARTIRENHDLLDQLENLNSLYSEAGGQINSLNETLQSTLKELDRLSVLAAQSSNLETQLANLEAEQQMLHNSNVEKEAGERSAIQRWKRAERTVCVLQEQVERIEREAEEERIRHAEVVARFERRRLVEKELENAAGRLKGAAAKTMSKEGGSGSVVSSFVKDILQDNANLQMGIVELREMLMGSNEEVASLREQMMQHQPMPLEQETKAATAFLDEELARTPTNEALPDLHVHHHYHAAPKADPAREKQPGLRRPRKRRQATAPGLRTPSSGSRTPSMAGAHRMHLTPISTAATIMAQTSVTIPSPSKPSHAHQWSMSQAASSAAPSSIPGSPTFDLADDFPGSSRPTTPGSTNFGSPELHPQHCKRGSDVSMQSILSSNSQNVPQSISGVLQGYDDPTRPVMDQDTILEEPEDNSSRPSTKDTFKECSHTETIRPILHRASSHESLLSVHGLDLPKIRSKPSQRLISGTRVSLGTSSLSTGPMAVATSATAHRSKAPPKGYDSSSNFNRLLSVGTTPAISTSTSETRKATTGNTLGRRVGGWISGKWGIAPEGSASSRPPSSIAKATKALARVVAPPVQKSKLEDDGPSVLESEGRCAGIDTSLLTESLKEENTKPQTSVVSGSKLDDKATNPEPGLDGVTPKRRGEGRPLSTHVEAMHIDGALLTEALDGL